MVNFVEVISVSMEIEMKECHFFVLVLPVIHGVMVEG